MTVYRQNANPNATNSELDAKVIIKHPQLTNVQREELIKQYVEIVVDNMSTESLVCYAQEQMEEYHDKLSDYDLREYIDCYDEELYNELVENIQIADLMKEVNSEE